MGVLISSAGSLGKSASNLLARKSVVSGGAKAAAKAKPPVPPKPASLKGNQLNKKTPPALPPRPQTPARSEANLAKFNQTNPPPTSKPLHTKDDAVLGGSSKSTAAKGTQDDLAVTGKPNTGKVTPESRAADKAGFQADSKTIQDKMPATPPPPAGQTTLPNGQPLPGGVKTDGKGGYINAENRPVNAQGRLIDKNGNRINADGSQLTRKQKIGEHFGNNANMYMLGGTTALMGVPMLMSGSGSSGTGSGAEAPANAGSASSSSYGYGGGGSSYGIPGSLYA